MALSNQDIEKYKKLDSEILEAEKTISSIETEIQMYKSQAMEGLKKLGYSTFSDVEKLRARKTELEEKILQEIKEKEDYIKYVNQIKEEKENVIMSMGIE